MTAQLKLRPTAVRPTVSGGSAVTLLVLLAAPTRAGIVPAHLGLVAPDGLYRRIVAAGPRGHSRLGGFRKRRAPGRRKRADGLGGRLVQDDGRGPSGRANRRRLLA